MALQGRPSWKRANGWDRRHSEKHRFPQSPSGEVVIGSPEEFARYANQICQVDSLYLPTAKISDEPEGVQYSFSIPDTLKTHRVVRGLSKHKIPYLKFYYMSTRWFGPECGHVENGQDENTCAFCLKSCNAVDNDVEWIKCPIYENWFHEQCFLVELLSWGYYEIG